MCFAAAPIVAMGISAAMSAASAYSSAKAQNNQAEHEAKVAENNAAIVRQEGRYAMVQAMRNATEQRKETASILGTQRAQQGASGVLVDSGSASDVVLNTAETGERQAVALLQEGDLESWRTENQARNHDLQSRYARSSKVSVTAAVASSALKSAASSASSFAGMGK